MRNPAPPASGNTASVIVCRKRGVIPEFPVRIVLTCVCGGGGGVCKDRKIHKIQSSQNPGPRITREDNRKSQPSLDIKTSQQHMNDFISTLCAHWDITVYQENNGFEILLIFSISHLVLLK